MERTTRLTGLGLAAALAVAATPALAQSPIPAATVDKGDTTWMLVSSLLVLMMSVPGLAQACAVEQVPAASWRV